MNKAAYRNLSTKCSLCQESDPATLSVHRIIPGERGGIYHPRNVCVLCENCHRRVHRGQLRIGGKYLSTAGRYVLHIVRDGGEEFVIC